MTIEKSSEGRFCFSRSTCAAKSFSALTSAGFTSVDAAETLGGPTSRGVSRVDSRMARVNPARIASNKTFDFPIIGSVPGPENLRATIRRRKSVAGSYEKSILLLRTERRQRLVLHASL